MYTKLMVNVLTGEEVYSEMSNEEAEEFDRTAAQTALEEDQRAEAAQALADLKASAKAKLIAGEPLTAEEADTLVI